MNIVPYLRISVVSSNGVLSPRRFFGDIGKHDIYQS